MSAGKLAGQCSLFSAAQCRYFAGDYAKAVQGFEQCVEEEIDLAQSWYYLGLSLLALGENERAAEALDKALSEMGQKVDYAINVEVPDENIVNRMSGRRACVGCGATYHIKYNPPKTEDVCDACGEKLILRDDDKPETVQKRLGVYHDQTQPLIDYYGKAGVLKEVDGTVDMEEVFQAIVDILGA